MKRDFDIAGAEEKIGAHFRSLRRSVKDPGSIRINNTEKAKEKKTAGLPLQLAGAFLAAAIVGGGTFTALKMMERRGNSNQAGSDTPGTASSSVTPEREEQSAVLIDLNAFPPPSEDGAAKVFTVFSNDKITVQVVDGYFYASMKDCLNVVRFAPGAGEKAECYAVWVSSGNGIKDTLLFVGCADGIETLWALGTDGVCVKVTDTDELSRKYGGDEQRNILPGVAADGSPMFSYRALLKGHTYKESWDIWHDFSVVNANGKLKAVHVMGAEVMKYLSSHDFFGLPFYAYGQTVSLKPYMLWTAYPDFDGTFVSADGPGAAGAEYGDIPVIYGEYGVSPDISFDLSRIKCDAFVYPLGYEGSVYEYDAEKALREFDGDEITLVLRVTYLTGSRSAARDTFGSSCYEYPVRIKFAHSVVPETGRSSLR